MWRAAHPDLGPTPKSSSATWKGCLAWKGAPGLFTAFARTGRDCGRRSTNRFSPRGDVSPDGRWLMAWAPLPGNGSPAQLVFPLDGGPPVPTGAIFSWSSDGSSMAIAGDFGAIIPEGRNYLVPLPRGQALPRIPAGGVRSEEIG